jgi:hypothetical protein
MVISMVDGFQDLAIGVAFENIRNVPAPSIINAGAVEVIYGTLYGLRATNRQFWQQGGAGVADVPEPEECARGGRLLWLGADDGRLQRRWLG